MTKAHLVKIARLELGEWKGLERSLVMAILFAFIHRATTGETVEQTFFSKPQPPIDYEI